MSFSLFKPPALNYNVQYIGGQYVMDAANPGPAAMNLYGGRYDIVAGGNTGIVSVQSGLNILDVTWQGAATTTFNIASGALLYGRDLSLGADDPTAINGSGNFWNGNTTVNGALDVGINTDVIGVGKFTINSTAGGAIVFAKSVSPGQTVQLAVGDVVDLQDPTQFHGKITNAGGGDSIRLDGLVADSVLYRHDLLSLYDNGRIVDVLRLLAAQGYTPAVVPNEVGGGGTIVDMIPTGSTPPSGALPTHT
jgi:hypothetical protein